MNNLTPKILIITETPPGTPNGFGVTLNCLFRDFDHKVIYTDASFRKHGEQHGYLLAQVPYHRAKKHLPKFLTGKIPEWRNHFSRLWLARNLNHHFDLVYAFVYSLNCLKYAFWISEKKGTRFIAHIADHSLDFETPLAIEILAQSDPMISISKSMKSHFKQMLKQTEIEVIHNGPEDQCFRLFEDRTRNPNKKKIFTITFLGGLFENLHSDSIEDIINAVGQVRQKHPQVEFHMYGQKVPASFLEEYLDRNGIFHHGLIMPLEKKYKIMQEADCFVVPSSFNPSLNREYRFSFPTKLMELLATGKPTLVYGRSDTSTYELMQRHKFDTCISKRSTSRLVSYFESLIQKNNEDDTFLHSQQTFIRENFHANCMRKKLANIFFK
ncbi:MAG: glycosyltransferase [Verrucomicrobiota bacterium]|nr:glycosyltransferase [Verrucomicrobiota bacterium]